MSQEDPTEAMKEYLLARIEEDPDPRLFEDLGRIAFKLWRESDE